MDVSIKNLENKNFTNSFVASLGELKVRNISKINEVKAFQWKV